GPQREAREGGVHETLRRRSGLRLPASDHRSARSLVHDGRQSWLLRRQPLLGTDPEEVDHRGSLRHLLASRPNRLPLAPSTRTRRPPSLPTPPTPRSASPAVASAARAGCSTSTASSGCASWRAPTRPAGAAWPARWW